uniref:Uncharacterized protein n=1 Tax=viral metagenome TaxID=1070528 RepID=A0A6M3JMK1_9ZZZZ
MDRWEKIARAMAEEIAETENYSENKNYQRYSDYEPVYTTAEKVLADYEERWGKGRIHLA